jgi:hypothetical protein
MRISRSGRLGVWGLTLVGVAIAASVGWGGCAAGQESGSGGEGGEDTGPDGGPVDGGSDATDAPVDTGPVDCTTTSECAGLDGPCSHGVCTDGKCAIDPNNELGACDDGNFCTENDTCVLGFCVGGTQKFCPSSDECHLGVCDEDSDSCKNITGNDGAQCDDDDPCTTVGICNAGTCAKGSQIDCTIFDSQCLKGQCDPVDGCIAVSANEGLPCDDGLFCNVEESCQAGVCIGGVPNPCAPPGGCYIASCDEPSDQCTAVPGNDGAACDDFSPCTVSTTCSNGACINGTPANDGMACDDGTMCTSGEFCSSGICGGGTGPAVYFADGFQDNSKGWTLGPEWSIGPAQVSSNGFPGADPDTDYTPTLDDGIAGIVIGGNASTSLHPYEYLESPPFDTSSATTVILGFRRWLNSDYVPFMNNVIEVWNGTQWIQIWESGPPPSVEDSPPTGLGWTFIQHDITLYKNPAMRIRFGMTVTSGGVYTTPSWNIDDVLVAAAACP